MANLHSDLVVSALLVTVSKETNLGSIGDNALDLDTELVGSSLLLLELHGVVDHLVVPGLGVLGIEGAVQVALLCHN